MPELLVDQSVPGSNLGLSSFIRTFQSAIPRYSKREEFQNVSFKKSPKPEVQVSKCLILTLRAVSGCTQSESR